MSELAPIIQCLDIQISNIEGFDVLQDLFQLERPHTMPKNQSSEAYRAFTKVLITARKESGLTQTELAERIGRKQALISIIETGIRRVDVIEFCALAQAMGYDPVGLFGRIYKELPDKIDM